MNNKNILIAISPETTESGLLSFMAENLNGENIKIVLCILNGSNDSPEIDELLDRVSLFCEKSNIQVKIRHLVDNIYEELENQTAYADLLIIQKNAIKPIALNGELDNVSCPVLVLPSSRQIIDNILFIMDGSRDSVLAIKQYAQIFSRQMKEMNITLLSLQGENIYSRNPVHETLLVEYLKQYGTDIGVLKVKAPLTDRVLKPIKYGDSTLVIGTAQFLLSQYGEHSSFKPFFDERSTIFLPVD